VHPPPVADSKARRFLLRSQLTWAAGGQVLSALSNALLVVVAAQGSSATELGALALVIAIYRLVLAVTRALVCEPLMAFRSAGSDQAGALHAAVLLGAAGSAVCLLAAGIAGQEARVSFLLLALGLPALCVQDVSRYVLVSRDAAGRSAQVDGTWLLIQLAGVGAAAIFTSITVPVAVATWVFGGFVAAATGLSLLRVRPGGGPAWLRLQRKTSTLFLVEYAAIHGAVQGAYLLIATITSSAAAGAMRGIETLYGPHSIILLGTRPALVRSLQARQPSEPEWASAMRRVAAGLLLTACATTALVLALPDQVGELALGDTWPAARRLAPAYGAYAVAVALSGVPMVGLRALAQPSRLARARAVEAPLSLALVAVGATWGGAEGAIIGLALGSLAGSTLAWRSLQRALARDLTRPVVVPQRPRSSAP